MGWFRRRKREDSVDDLQRANQELDEELYKLEVVLKKDKKTIKKIEIGFDFGDDKR